MKILHLADLHLGKLVNGLSMIENQEYVLNECIELCEKEHIKHIIIAGDVYDRAIPPESAVKLLNDFLSVAIIEKKWKVYIISGNHDSQERLGCFNEILERQGIYIDNRINEDLKLTKHVLEEDGVKVNLYALPYFHQTRIRTLTGDESITDLETATKRVIEANEINKNEINFLSTHLFVSGIEELVRSGSESRLSVGTIEQVSYRVFDDFDYVALGHLHAPQKVGRETVRYAGSPLRYDVSEIEQHKAFTIIDVKSKDDIQIEKVEIKPLYNFVYKEGTVDELTQNSEIKDFDLIYFKLTDKKVVLNASSRLKIKYPHFIGLEYTQLEGEENTPTSLTKGSDFESLTPSEQFDKFFTYMLGKEMDEIQKETVESICEEIFKEDK